MFGKNIPIKPVYILRGKLNVIDIWRTIQGEGPFTGTPAIFIRFAGCNLRCYFCDTEFTEGTHEMSLEEIQDQVRSVAPPAVNLIVMTGGEPLAQPIAELASNLTGMGYHVQIETAGTVFQKALEPLIRNGKLSLVCSPKTATLNSDVARFCDHYKYIIREGEQDPKDGLPNYSTQIEGRFSDIARPPNRRGVTVWVQPCDEYQFYEDKPRYGSIKAPDAHDVQAIKRNIAACVETALVRGYRISFQLHKVLGVE